MAYGSVFRDEEDDEDLAYDTQSTGPSGCERCCDVVFPAGFCSEFKKMIVITWPICMTQICQMIIGPISLIFCGHLGDAVKLDGAAMAISMINATCISVGQGMGTACDTFFSQSYGSKNRKKVGLYLQKALCIFMLALIGCITLNINMELLLRMLGQDPEVAHLAGQYMLIFIPGAIGFFIYVILSKYIQNQNIVMPNLVIGLIANAVNMVLHYIFLYHLDWATAGSALAQSVSYVLMCLLTLSYIVVFKKYRETWDGWSSQCLQDWGQFGRLAVPGMLMVCLEWWGFEIGVFLTGLLGKIELGAQSVLLQIDSIWFQIPLGIQIATSIRIGQYLGSGNKLGAITATRLGIFSVFVLSILMCVMFLLFRYQLPYLFTNVTDIAELTGDLLPIVALYMIFDGLATACKGVLYGTGRQTIGAIILFVSYYLLALPAGVPLMFLTSLRSAAYWWALAFNLVLQAIVLLTLVFRTNWDHQIEKAQERAGMMGEVMQDETADETARLVPDIVPDKPARRHSRRHSRVKVRRDSRNRLLSVSLTLTTSEIKALMEVHEEEPLGRVLLKRILTLFIMLCIFGAGVAARMLVHLPDHHSPGVLTNATTERTPDNRTAVVPDIILPDDRTAVVPNIILPDDRTAVVTDIILPDNRTVLPDYRTSALPDTILLPEHKTSALPDNILPEGKTYRPTGTYTFIPEHITPALPDIIPLEDRTQTLSDAIFSQDRTSVLPDIIGPVHTTSALLEDRTSALPDAILPEDKTKPDVVLPEDKTYSLPYVILPEHKTSELPDVILLEAENSAAPDVIKTLPDAVYGVPDLPEIQNSTFSI